MHNPASMSPTIRKKIIRKTKSTTLATTILTSTDNDINQFKKPKVKKLIKKKKRIDIQALQAKVIDPKCEIVSDNSSNESFDYSSDSDLEEVLVKPWKCISNNTDYLLDPITQEVYDKISRDLIGIRYRNDDDEISLVDFN